MDLSRALVVGNAFSFLAVAGLVFLDLGEGFGGGFFHFGLVGVRSPPLRKKVRHPTIASIKFNQYD